MDRLPEIISEFTKTNPVLYWSVSVFLVLVICYLLFNLWRKNSDKRKVSRIFKKVGSELLSNIALPDGVDGYVFIDYLLLTKDGIIIVDLKDYAGLIFGGENTDQWAQVLGRKSYKFENPLYQNQNRIAAVQALVPGIPVTGWVVFTDAGEFPKGKPENVYMLNTLLANVGKAGKKNEIPELTKLAWQKIRSILEEGRLSIAG